MREQHHSRIVVDVVLTAELHERSLPVVRQDVDGADPALVLAEELLGGLVSVFDDEGVDLVFAPV